LTNQLFTAKITIPYLYLFLSALPIPRVFVSQQEAGQFTIEPKKNDENHKKIQDHSLSGKGVQFVFLLTTNTPTTP